MLPDIYDPQQLNRYAYVRNNPLKYVDPTGNYIDLIVEVGFIGLDVVTLINDPSVENGAYLVVDVGLAFVPFIPGGVGAAAKVVKAVAKTDDVIDVAKTVDNAGDVVKHIDDVKLLDNPNHLPPSGGNPPSGSGWEWRGSGDPVGGKGNWYNPQTKQKWNPDLNHPEPIGPHWDYTDSAGQKYRVDSNGNYTPKVNKGSNSNKSSGYVQPVKTNSTKPRNSNQSVNPNTNRSSGCGVIKSCI